MSVGFIPSICLEVDLSLPEYVNSSVCMPIGITGISGRTAFFIPKRVLRYSISAVKITSTFFLTELDGQISASHRFIGAVIKFLMLSIAKLDDVV